MMLFSKNHIWINTTKESIKIGASDYAQGELGSIVFLNLPEVGDQLAIGEKFGDIESLKTVSDLISPLSGIVTAVNEVLVDNPEDINAMPCESWFIEVQVESLANNLMDEPAYKTFTETL